MALGPWSSAAAHHTSHAGPIILEEGQSWWAWRSHQGGPVCHLFQKTNPRDETPLKCRTWALFICTASGHRKTRHKGSNTHIYTVFFRSSCSPLRLKKTQHKGPGAAFALWVGTAGSCPLPFLTLHCDLGQVSLLSWPPSPKATSSRDAQ